MSSLSPRLQIRVQQKQILTPGLVQMVSLLQLNRLELKDMITAEIAQNPVLEEAAEGGEELSPEELQPLLEAERVTNVADQGILDVTPSAEAEDSGFEPEPVVTASAEAPAEAPETPEAPASSDPFDEIDFGSYFDDYLDPGFKSPSAEASDKPSFETFLSSPVTLSDHLRSQLALVTLSEDVRDAAEGVIGNLDENGYLLSTPEDMATEGEHTVADVREAIHVVQGLDPAGVAAADLRECLLLQLESRNARDGVAWTIVSEHLKLVETRQVKELARVLRRPLEHIQMALEVIRHLDPRPGLRYSGAGARVVEPDVYIYKDGEDYIIQVSGEVQTVDLRGLKRSARRQLEGKNEWQKDQMVLDAMYTLEKAGWAMQIEEKMTKHHVVWAINPSISSMFRDHREKVIKAKQRHADYIYRYATAKGYERKLVSGYDPDTMDE